MTTKWISLPLFPSTSSREFSSLSRVPSLLWLTFLSLLFFMSLALPATHHYLLPGDELVYYALRAGHSPFYNSLFRALTKAGRYPVLIPVGIGVVIWQRTNRRLLLFLALYTLGTPLLEIGAKYAIARPRPRYLLEAGPLVHSSHGFPSGHALAAAALYGMLLVLLHRRESSRGWQWAITGSLLLLILLIGVSRIYRAAHWPSDVLGGYALGAAYCSLATVVYRWIENRGETKQAQAGAERGREA
jgi:undecaprenyl-diphosphatase